MSQETELQPNLGRHLLMLSSGRTTSLEWLLQIVLQKAVAVTSSEMGAIFIFDTSNQKSELVAHCLHGNVRETSTNLIKHWKERVGSEILRFSHPDQLDDNTLYQDNPPCSSFFAGTKSSIWAPMLNGHNVGGLLYVGSTELSHYSPAHFSQLRALGGEVLPAIHRLLLRKWMAEASPYLGGLDMVGVSAPFLDLERQIRLVAACPSGSVLITGERGSGKELASRAIYCWGNRRGKPFVPVLTSALTESLFADELFGHVRHAFTGADQSRSGKFQAAEGGTLFLDEVGDMPAVIQSALLRVIERGELTRIGSDLPLCVDVRVIAATNRNLPLLINQGKFRADLYDRLSVFEIRVPPLRERRIDIPILVSHFLRKYCEQMGRDFMLGGKNGCTACKSADPVDCATREFYQSLETYDWLGNVRELSNLILRLLATVPDEILDRKHLPEQYRHQTAKAPVSPTTDLALDMQTRKHIDRVLDMVGHNESQAARILGIPRSTLRSKIKKLGIDKKRN